MLKHNQIFQEALKLFNNEMGTDFSTDNIMLCICKQNDFDSKRTQFIEEFSFNTDKSNSATVTLAEAFAYGYDNGNPISGIIFVDYPEITDAYEIMHAFLHELSHIYCTKNEVQNGHFYDDYCSDTSSTSDISVENGYYNAGYAIWRELAAEIMSYSILPSIPYGIESVIQNYEFYEENITPFSFSSKIATSDLLTKIAFTEEAATLSTEELLEIVRKSPLSFIDKTLGLVMPQLNQEPFYKITSEFIFDLGVTYITMLTERIK